MESKKNDINGLIYKSELDPQTEKTNLWLPEEMGEGVCGRRYIRSFRLTYIHYYKIWFFQ